VTLTHLHLLLNHVPTLGSVVALGLLLLAFVRRNEHLKQVGLEVLFIIAIVTLPLYVTGVAALRELRDQADVSEIAIRIHQDVALMGFTFTEFTGFVAWIALWQYGRYGRFSRGLVPVVTLLLLLSLAVMARAANLGGEIRHPEIRSAAIADIDKEQFIAARISEYMTNSTWAWPAAETVHFLGFSLSIGVLLAVNLRILGVMQSVPFAALHRMLPWGMLGFGANLITGMLFFVGQPAQYMASAPFFWKILFLMIAAANFLYLTVFRKGWAAPGLDFNLADKAMAVASMVAWFGVLYAGRMLPFLGSAF
jgi:hypothetical protein